MSVPLSSTPASRWPLAGLSLAMLLASLGTSIANVGLPTLAQAFAAPIGQVQWVVIAYLLATTTLIVSVGRLGDLVGRRRLLLAGIALYTAASAICGLAPSLWLLVAARAAQGIGAAVMMALAMALAGEAVPKERTGAAMGLLGTMSAVGTALGPSLGGVLIAGFGWPAIFLVGMPLGLAALALAWHGLPADRAAAERPAAFDRLGTVVLAATLGAYALAMTQGNFGPANLALLLAAALGAGLFVAVERRVAAPLIRLAVLREPALASALITNALVATVMMTTLVVGPFYLAGGLGLDAVLVGLVMSGGPVVSALSGVPAGRLVDRFGAGRAMLIGLAGVAAGAFGLALLPAAWGIPAYIAPLLVMTPGYQLFQAANNTAVMKDVPGDRRGGISGLLTLSRNLGLITGASAMGAVFSLAAAAGDARSGMQLTFAVAGCMAVAGLLVAGGNRSFPRFLARF